MHAIVIDGVFAAHDDSVVFQPLARLIDSDVADLLQVIRVRVVNWLVRRGIQSAATQARRVELSASWSSLLDSCVVHGERCGSPFPAALWKPDECTGFK